MGERDAKTAGEVSRQPRRLESIDVYRGFVMLLMMAEVLQLGAVARAFPESRLAAFLAHHQSHVGWEGCSLHDLIQPSFSFLVGVALPFSLAARAARGQSTRVMAGHALWRAAVLVAWARPLEVIGMNSIAAYLIVHLWHGFIDKALLTHLGPRDFAVAGPGMKPLPLGVATLSVMWAFLWWMQKRRILLRV